MTTSSAGMPVRPSAQVCGVPHHLLTLIDLSVQLKQRASTARVQGASLRVQRQMHADISEALTKRQGGKAFITVPLEAYARLADIVIAETRQWPHEVWEAIRNVCEAASFIPRNAAGLGMLVDHFAWPAGAKPPSLAQLDAERFAGARKRLFSRMGRRDDEAEASFARSLALKSGLATVALMNTAAEARASVRLEIEMFVLRAQTAERKGRALPTGQAAGGSPRPATSTSPRSAEAVSRSEVASRAAHAKHKKSGIAEKKQMLIDIWASGHYDSKDRCAEEECGALGIAQSTGRAALRNQPKPPKQRKQVKRRKQ